MSDIDITQLRRLDMTLLVVFAELVRQRKMTIVAQRLGLTQSAISHSLKRLRDVFQDELFRRVPNGLQPTERALRLESKVSPPFWRCRPRRSASTRPSIRGPRRG